MHSLMGALKKLNLISLIPQCQKACCQGQGHQLPSCSFTHIGGPIVPYGKAAYIGIISIYIIIMETKGTQSD